MNAAGYIVLAAAIGMIIVMILLVIWHFKRGWENVGKRL